MLPLKIALCSTPRCFNEAEARAPRMQRRRVTRISKALRFNEAEARAPRMRGRENVRARRRDRGFNEAEARAPRMQTRRQTHAHNWRKLQ